jgi:predicted ATPase
MHLKRVVLHPETYPTKTRYPFILPIFHQTECVEFYTPITMFAGENGTGKSTLLEALAHRCHIHIWRELERLRFEVNPYEKRFCDYISVEWVDGCVPGSYFDSKTFEDFAQILDEWAAADPGQLKYFGGRSLMTQSHGQSLLSFFAARYKIRGLYLLDEPETALSPRSQLELLRMLTRMGRQGHAQFIIATHSPILLACPGATIYSFDHTPLKAVSYEETSHYQIYASFLEAPGRYLSGL